MRIGRVTAGLLAVVMLAGCAKATAGTPEANKAAADRILADAALTAFQDHFRELGDEHARVFNYLNFGDTKITSEHESFKLGNPPMTVLLRTRDDESEPSAVLHPPDAPLDYVRLDEGHAHLAPTPWVSVPSLYGDEFQTCFLLTAWLACHLDSALAQTKVELREEMPREAVRTEDGVTVTTGALLGLMIEEGFISIPEEERDKVTDAMRDQIVPVTIELDAEMRFTGFEIRGKVADGDATPLELQIGYEVLGTATEEDFPEVPPADQITNISDPAKADEFWEKFNSRDPEE
ncbi:hypothetical protein [Actinophytocola xanthii]|uniref:Lipoprotein n=1 Tax=Actinophytocola xanthii TaxID=1912961 RepID=A0A1Q8CMN8_9PSEU|nr:hypothetical protein [Actinophytocola xanthii]OLF15628.1 hypothetical protein BU204_21185 [Actinophytocola xanthii]